MRLGLIFDLDQTLVDSSIAEAYRDSRQWQKVYELIPSFRLYDGMREVLDEIVRMEFPIVVATSSHSSYCLRVLKYWDIPNIGTICFHDTTRRKPFPDPILKAISLYLKDCNKVLSFGDRDIDIKASNDAKVISVACTWGSADPKTLSKSNPTHTISDSVEILKIINFYNGGVL